MLTPQQVHDNACSTGCDKVHLSNNNIKRLSVLAIAAGAYIALGAMLSVVVGRGFPGLTQTNPALANTLAGLTFPIGLTLIVLLGGELFTGNNATLIPGLAARRFGIISVARNWTLVWIFNFIGAILIIALFVAGAGIFDADPWQSAITGIATAKVSMPWWTVFFKAIGANWCVCLAVWLAMTARTMPAKTLGCWIPVFAFVAMGFEHCIANMFFIPAGIICGAPVTAGQLFFDNLVPATLGNIVGGALLVGCLSAYLHHHPQTPTNNK